MIVISNFVESKPTLIVLYHVEEKLNLVDQQIKHDPYSIWVQRRNVDQHRPENCETHNLEGCV